MGTKVVQVVTLAEMINGQEADLFALLTSKEELTTRDGKPYFKVGFRDAGRHVQFPVWNDSTWADDCRSRWVPGCYYKLRAVYRETNYGPQLEIRKIREVCDADTAEGFDPANFLPRSKFDSDEMYDELVAIAKERIGDRPLRDLVLGLLKSNRSELLTLPAATRNHHCFVGGYLEHVLSVTRTAVMLADKYDNYYPDLRPPLNKGLVAAGAILHDIGKLHEIAWQPGGAEYTPAGTLVGHILQGRDIVRDAAAAQAAAGKPLDPETLLRLEHIIISHQRLPEWGSPKPPMTPEALLVHYADDLDAKYHMIYVAFRDDPSTGPLTSNKNQLFQKLFRGGQ
ncbi:MAG TPA: HD domain-containing protein [Pirellulales bacterium]|nr:HD domain-containing protein [Pirellulales bacterium]